MTPDHRFRRAEGSGPWLHPPRKPARTAPGSAVMLAIWAFLRLKARGRDVTAQHPPETFSEDPDNEI